MKRGAAGNIAASQLQASQFDPELELQPVWSFSALSLSVHTGFFQVL